jgi:hypothetical protein
MRTGSRAEETAALKKVVVSVANHGQEPRRKRREKRILWFKETRKNWKGERREIRLVIVTKWVSGIRHSSH